MLSHSLGASVTFTHLMPRRRFPQQPQSQQRARDLRVIHQTYDLGDEPPEEGTPEHNALMDLLVATPAPNPIQSQLDEFRRTMERQLDEFRHTMEQQLNALTHQLVQASSTRVDSTGVSTKSEPIALIEDPSSGDGPGHLGSRKRQIIVDSDDDVPLIRRLRTAPRPNDRVGQLDSDGDADSVVSSDSDSPDALHSRQCKNVKVALSCGMVPAISTLGFSSSGLSTSGIPVDASIIFPGWKDLSAIDHTKVPEIPETRILYGVAGRGQTQSVPAPDRSVVKSFNSAYQNPDFIKAVQFWAWALARSTVSLKPWHHLARGPAGSVLVSVVGNPSVRRADIAYVDSHTSHTTVSC
ncbi:unnamed protein product [Periconia digitata]|uniref:Uncharacterized protein n=1 Tax=Periconia digitata TaxID=1303443 RepID=A0A9W4UKI0_9PLEO|nr:unnamed protein product [Periconia digitata]